MAVLHAAHRSPLGLLPTLAFGVLAVLMQCRGAPTAPSAIPVALSIVPSTTRLAVGDEVDLTLQAYITATSVAIMSPAWWTDDSGVLQVKPLSTSRSGEEPGTKAEVIDHYLRGHVTALAPGTASVFAECQHGRAELRVTVF